MTSPFRFYTPKPFLQVVEALFSLWRASTLADKPFADIFAEFDDHFPIGFEVYFKEQRHIYIHDAFPVLWKEMKSTLDANKQPEVVQSSRRVVYRWILSLFHSHSIAELPASTREWKDMQDENCMYTLSMREMGLSAWEQEQCPWWLDYPIGKRPVAEEELHARFLDMTNASGKEISMKLNVLSTATTGVEEESKKKKPKEQHHPQKLDFSKVDPPEEVVAPSHKPGVVTRQTGIKEQTVIDVLLVDVENMDNSARQKLFLFFNRVKAKDLPYKGNPCVEVANLVWADFPTSLAVAQIGSLECPDWNHFTPSLSRAVASFADEFVADEGFYITCSLASHFSIIQRHATKKGFVLIGQMTLLLDGGYVYPDTGDEVDDVLLGIFHRDGHSLPSHDREAGEAVDPKLFGARKSYIMESLSRGETHRTRIKTTLLRGGAQRSELFFQWLLVTFTEPGETVVDVFAGCGGLGYQSINLLRHCFCMDKDPIVYRACLQDMPVDYESN